MREGGRGDESESEEGGWRVIEWWGLVCCSLACAPPCNHATWLSLLLLLLLLLLPSSACLQAIDLIDEAGSRVRLRHIQLPEEARDLDKELKQVGERGGGERERGRGFRGLWCGEENGGWGWRA